MNMKTLWFILTRVLLAAFTLWVISVFVFVVMELPEEDAIDRYYSELCRRSIDCHRDEYLDAVYDYYGLDRPLYVQYGLWISRIVFKNEFGLFIPRYRSIEDLMTYVLLVTSSLLVSTSILIWAASIPMGVYLAMRRRSFEDRVFTVVGAVGQNVPQLLLALLLMYFLFACFGLSVGGPALFLGPYIDEPWTFAKVVDMLQYLIWPSVVLGAAGVARQARLLRDTLCGELAKPYVLAARSRGVGRWKLFAKYHARMVFAQLIIGFRGLLPGLVSGSVIVSVVMNLDAIGTLMANAVLNLDTYLYGAIFLILCALVVVGALVCDIVLGAVDPRVRLRGSAVR